jgi:hypothetical protein
MKALRAFLVRLNGLVLRPLPVREPGLLQMVRTTGPHLGNNQGSRAASYPMYQDFQQMVLKEALALLAVGIGVRLPAAWPLGHLLESQLFGVAPADARTVAAAWLILAAVTTAAALLPARRASTIDPLRALRRDS